MIQKCIEQGYVMPEDFSHPKTCIRVRLLLVRVSRRVVFFLAIEHYTIGVD